MNRNGLDQRTALVYTFARTCKHREPPVKIALCTPFKPLDNPTLSGDVTIARDLADGLRAAGHEVVVLPHSPAKELWKKPGRWIPAHLAANRIIEAARGADCWLTYGTYYKVPDVFGPKAKARLGIPYFIYQASYAENRGKRLATWPGFALNRRAMLAADHLFINRINDLRGCAKLLPPERYSHVKPALPDGLFARDEAARERLRAEWGAGDTLVIATAAMMRPGVKTEGMRWVIASCEKLLQHGRDFLLAVAGDGPNRPELERVAREKLGDRVRFLGMVDRAELSGFFSAADLFAFPGLEESVGMVYLEAQACGLPVVATDDEGAPHVVAGDRTGLITPAHPDDFTAAVGKLLTDDNLRQTLAANTQQHIQESHTMSANLSKMLDTMERITQEKSA